MAVSEPAFGVGDDVLIHAEISRKVVARRIVKSIHSTLSGEHTYCMTTGRLQWILESRLSRPTGIS